MSDLQAKIEAIAAETGEMPADIITNLQGAAAATGNEELLDELCALKWCYASHNEEMFWLESERLTIEADREWEYGGREY